MATEGLTMHGLLEFHGRLSRSDKRPANPGSYSLLFQLHGHSRSGAKRDKVYWEETLHEVEIAPGGFYRVVLGRAEQVPPKIFSTGPRWMSVQVIRSGRLDVEHNLRIPVLGHELLSQVESEKVTVRLDKLEASLESMSGSTTRVDVFHTKFRRILEAVEALEERTAEVEDPTTTDALIRRLEALTTRLDEVDRDEGRLDKLELELEDLVGPDGDVVDMNARMDRVEASAPELISALRERERHAPRQRELTDVLEELERALATVKALELRLFALGERVGAGLSTKPSPEEIGALRRSGDVMTGGLTINRGGLQVLSGGISCRGASVTTLEASKQIKAPKAIVDGIELRGDLTVDSAQRALQVRYIEGRKSSARRDGALHLNGRSGGDVVVGTAASGGGLQVHGVVQAPQLSSSTGSCLAQLFESAGDLSAGDVVRVNDDGTKVQRVRKADDPRIIGVVSDSPGMLLGGPIRSGAVSVAISGVVLCRVDASVQPVVAGDLLVASRMVGHACRPAAVAAPGALLGKALAPLAGGQGLVPVLLGRG
jgi:hypothetical protein